MGVEDKSAELGWETAASMEISTTCKPLNSNEQGIGYSCPVGHVPSTGTRLSSLYELFKNE